MTRFQVSHTTKYAYTEPVSVCHNKVHLAPRDLASQKCIDFRFLVIPEPLKIEMSDDYFGNRVDYFSLTDAHHGLSVTATSIIEVKDVPSQATFEDSVPWEEVLQEVKSLDQQDAIETILFSYASDYSKPDKMFADYARASFSEGRPIVEAIKDLTSRIHQDFEYDPRTTNVATPIEQVMEQKSGVCQDFAHLEIACLRSLGLPARYVSGYLRTLPPPGKPRLVGADASHAWISVYCGALGWIDFDPTNNVIPRKDYITIAYGRDYGDVCPIQGVFVGGGDHTMSVSVDVQEIES